MKFKVPVFGLDFIEKTVNADFVQAFLGIFRDTKDIHRVLVLIPLAALISHSVYLKSTPHISVLTYSVKRDELIWICLEVALILFVFSWAVFSSPFNPVLYGRQFIFGIWTVLSHRLLYGLESLGTPFFNTVSLIFLTGSLPFAFTGLRIDQLYKRYKEKRQSQKEERQNERPVRVISDSGSKSA